MAALDTDVEHFCEVEQNSFPDSAFGMDPEGLIVHIKSDPTGGHPGTGHTLQGWNVSFHGTPSTDGGMWQLSRVSERP
ncbi:hypothetical protein ACX80J_14555 [Arthrobacter sp. MDB2-24]